MKSRSKENTLLGLFIFFCFNSHFCFAQHTINTDSLEKVLKNSGEDTSKVKLLNSLVYYFIKTDSDKALLYGNNAINLSIKLNFKDGLASAYNNIGSLYWRLGAYKNSLKYYLNSLSLNEEMHNLKGIASAFGNIGNVYLDEANYDSALAYQLKSLGIEQQIGDKKRLSDTYHNLGLVYEGKADYKTALDYYLKDLKIEEEVQDTIGLAQAFNSVGNIYFVQGLFDKAISYHQQAQALMEIIHDKLGLSYSLNNIGNAYVQKGEYTNALKYYNHALTILESIGDKKGIIACLDNIGAVHYFLKQYPDAIRYFEKSKEISDEVGNKQGVASALINIGELNLAIKHYSEAVRNYKEGINIAKQIGAKDRQRDGYKGLSDAYIAMKDYKNGYENYTHYTDVKDLIFNEENSKNIDDLQIKYETDKKEKENALLRKDKIIDEARITQQKNQKLNWVISSSLLIVMGCFIFYFWRKKGNLRFSQQLSEVRQQALNAQMSDHFIGNTMISINRFIKNNEHEKASEYLIMIDRLIQRVLANVSKKTISLKEDIEMLEDYLGLEKLQFKEGVLKYEIIIDKDIDVENVFIPPMIFQVLTENSIKHGFKKNEGGVIILKVIKKGNVINCIVEDNGIGRKEAMRLATENRTNKKSYGSGLAEKLIKISSGLGEKSFYKIIDLLDEKNNGCGTRIEFILPYSLNA